MTDLLIKRGFDPDRLFTIYNGIDFTPRTPALSREEYFRSVGLEADGDSVVVGIAARLNPVKDIATLIRGFARAHAEYPLCGFSSQGTVRRWRASKNWPPTWGLPKKSASPGGFPTRIPFTMHWTSTR